MKKFTKVLVVLLIAVICFCAFSACKGEEGNVKLFVIGADGTVKSYFVDTTGKELVCLEDFMKYLAESEEEFTYTSASGMVLTINGIEPDFSKNEFWAIFTDVTIDGVPYFNNDWGTVTVEDATYGSAAKGVTELPLNAGATYVFKISSWQ